MSELRFLEELGAEFRRIDIQDSSRRAGRRGGRWERGRRGAREAVVLGLAVLLTGGVAAAVLSAHGRQTAGSASHGRGVRVVFAVEDQRFGWQRSIGTLRLRLDSALHGVKVERVGGTVVVIARGASSATRARIVALATPGDLAFYDWEQNVLLGDGRTVASVLKTLPRGYSRNPSLLTPSQRDAIAVSQGSGFPGKGSLSLYDAVKLASKQPVQVSTDPARPAPQHYLFGAPGSAACKIAAKHYGYTLRPDQHCLLSGPDTSVLALDDGLPRGIGPSQAERLTVPPGTVLLQAASSHFSLPTSSQPSLIRKESDPSARFYVLKDDVALSASDIINPQQSTDATGAPDVTFGFTSTGAAGFHRLTRQVANRARQISEKGSPFFQHFAVAIDGQLITVPYINFEQYPNGLLGRHGADILGGFTIRSARTLATLLRFGPLGVNFYLVKASP